MSQFSHFSHSYRNLGKFLTQTLQNLAIYKWEKWDHTQAFEKFPYKRLNFLNIFWRTSLFNLKEWVKTGFCRISCPMDESSVLINLEINAHTWYHERDCCIFFVIDAHRRASALPECLGLTSQLIPLFSYEGKTSKTAYGKRDFRPLLKTLILGVQKNV